MRRLPAFYREQGVPYIYDPGQQLPVLSGEDLLAAVEGSLACITNDYELNMICKATGKTEDELLGRTLWLVTTLGAEGALVRGADGTELRIPPVPPARIIDPTGAATPTARACSWACARPAHARGRQARLGERQFRPGKNGHPGTQLQCRRIP